MIADDGRLTLGWMIGLPAILLTLVICVLVAAYSLYVGIVGDNYDSDMAWMFGLIAVVVGIATAVLGAFALWPLDRDYHRWYAVEGEVLEIDSRLVGSGDSGTSEKFVVRLAPDDREFGITDTRAALLQVGDTVSLSCKRIYVYAGAHGWDCNWVGSSSERR